MTTRPVTSNETDISRSTSVAGLQTDMTALRNVDVRTKSDFGSVKTAAEAAKAAPTAATLGTLATSIGTLGTTVTGFGDTVASTC